MGSPSTSNPLAELEAAFQRYLQETALYPGLDAIVCQLLPTGIRLVGQHPAPEVMPPTSLLRNLEAAFREIMAEVPLPAILRDNDVLPVQIQLQSDQSPTPYATHTFSWQLKESATLVFEEEFARSSQAAYVDAAESALDETAADGLPTPSGANPAVEPPPEISSEISPETKDEFQTAGKNGSRNGAATAVHPGAADPDQAGDSQIVLWQADTATSVAGNRSLPHWLTTSGHWLARYGVYGLASTIVVGSTLLAYGITRPCVVGDCDRLETAEELSLAAQTKIDAASSPDAVLEAQQDLAAAVSQLRAIPVWSAHHATAAAARQDYQRTLDQINRIETAQAKATQAVQNSQSPPYPVSDWVETQQYWRQAIAQLEAVPDESWVYPLAQQKLTEYQANYDTIGQRIDSEETAQEYLNLAVQSAQIATQRSELAESAPEWELAERDWQTAVQQLSLIPQGTMAYSEAREYLQDYRNQLSRAGGRSRVEGLASTEYQRAKTAAQVARSAVDRNQWTLAVENWQDALAAAEAVPSNTSLSTEAQAMVEEYRAALDQARLQLRTAVAVQKMQALLGEVCGGPTPPCTLTSEPNQIRLTLNAQYAQALEAAITPPGSLDGTVTLAAERLIEGIIALGDEAQPPLAIYDASGQLIARYRSDLGGFVRD